MANTMLLLEQIVEKRTFATTYISFVKFSFGSLKKIGKRKELFISKEIFQLSIEIKRYEVAKY